MPTQLLEALREVIEDITYQETAAAVDAGYLALATFRLYLA